MAKKKIVRLDDKALKRREELTAKMLLDGKKTSEIKTATLSKFGVAVNSQIIKRVRLSLNGSLPKVDSTEGLFIPPEDNISSALRTSLNRAAYLMSKEGIDRILVTAQGAVQVRRKPQEFSIDLQN